VSEQFLNGTSAQYSLCSAKLHQITQAYSHTAVMADNIVGHGYNCRIPFLQILQETQKTFPNFQISDYCYYLISLGAE